MVLLSAFSGNDNGSDKNMEVTRHGGKTLCGFPGARGRSNL